jgi:hypothetical protein
MTTMPPPDRPRALRLRSTLGHDDRRVAHHLGGYVDPERVRVANQYIAAGRWASLFGSLDACPLWMPAEIIAFPHD